MTNYEILLHFTDGSRAYVPESSVMAYVGNKCLTKEAAWQLCWAVRADTPAERFTQIARWIIKNRHLVDKIESKHW